MNAATGARRYVGIERNQSHKSLNQSMDAATVNRSMGAGTDARWNDGVERNRSQNSINKSMDAATVDGRRCRSEGVMNAHYAMVHHNI